MKILVTISKTPDTTSKVAFTDNDTQYDTTGVQWIINPYDEWYSLVKAVDLKEKDASHIVHIVTVGDASSDAILRKALAIGGDEAIRINKISTEPFDIASQIAHIAKEGNYDLIFTGKESIDYNAASVGAILAELLELPFVPLSNKLTFNASVATISREIEGGEEINEVSLPFVIGTTKGMAEQRIPNMRGIMAARSKPLKVVEPIPTEAEVEIIQYELPKAKSGVKLFEPGQESELVKVLHETEKVI
ncbi:MAG: electron transfer flavoprotein subunit alpha [Pseudopedobacter saltans]|uniref:Electron transfer flavoprotein subunit alpha n=1 Tax=Pseudopedobacter saltans TaxID=151895 RepID=A0A2W5H3M9_9SPHI|nr:MAG: electron transfer flavoprotein subunit alpha [Pseudopedobacter saltans]